MYRSLDIPCKNMDTCFSELSAAILSFLVISAFVTIAKDLLEFTQQKPNKERYFIQPYHVYQGCLLRATILLILDEFRQSKLQIWRHAYWGHDMLSSWNWCYAVENLFVHKFIKSYVISLKTKMLHREECSEGISPHLQHKG